MDDGLTSAGLQFRGHCGQQGSAVSRRPTAKGWWLPSFFLRTVKEPLVIQLMMGPLEKMATAPCEAWINQSFLSVGGTQARRASCGVWWHMGHRLLRLRHHRVGCERDGSDWEQRSCISWATATQNAAGTCSPWRADLPSREREVARVDVLTFVSSFSLLIMNCTGLCGLESNASNTAMLLILFCSPSHATNIILHTFHCFLPMHLRPSRWNDF